MSHLTTEPCSCYDIQQRSRKQPNVGKRRHGEPDRFQHSGLAIDERPASDDAALDAVKRFVEAFITTSKRERVQAGLLHRTQQRRIETIQSAHEWLDSSLQSELEGNAGFHQLLHERFGDLRGVMIDDRGERHITVAGAAVLSSGRFGAIFIADSSPIALLFAEDGAPTLCLC
jgi:hypothetical protein